MPIPPPAGYSLKIYEGDPGPATQSVFDRGIPSTNTDSADLAIVLFSPNLQIVAALDNSNSQATSSYSTSVTRGFTFSTTQSLSITASVGVTVEIVTASVSVTFALSFTEEWSTSETKTISFDCPPGKKAFVYQGTLMSKVMKFSPGDATYSWVSAPSKVLTELVVTSATPVGSAPSNSVSIPSA